MSADEAIIQYKADPDIEYAEPNHQVQVQGAQWVTKTATHATRQITQEWRTE